MSKNEADGTEKRNGRWGKGVSGNPAGRAKRIDAAPKTALPAEAEFRPAVTDPRFDVGDLLGHPDMTKPRAELVQGGGRGARRMDDWRNLLTGQGVHGRDKRMGGFFAPVLLTFDQLRDLWLGDHLAGNAVEMIPKEANRPGYDITIADEGENDTDAEDMGQEIKDKLKVLEADQGLQTIGNYKRAYGGGALWIGANDKQTDLTQPLNLDKVVSLDWLTPLEARECIPVYAYGDPQKPHYQKPEIYQIVSRSMLPSRGGVNTTMTMVHESRLIVFDGIRVSKYQATGARSGWGESILTRVWRVLRDFNTAWSSAGTLVTDFAQTVIKMQGLWAALAEDDGKAFEDRLTAMDAGRSTINAITIDANDSFERQQTPLTGLTDLLREFAIQVAAASGMPLTLLFGTSPAGMNATGESDIRFFYDRVDEYRTSTLEPAYRKLIQILFRTIGNKREPAKWSLKFKPLWQESAKDMASAMLTQAQADSAWISSQVITPDEVAEAHWGQGEYNPHLSLDHESRDAQATATEDAPTPEDLAALGRTPTDPAAAGAAGAGLNGAQVSAMVEVIKAAVAGEIPRESAAAILQVAVPGVTPDKANALLGPVGFKGAAATAKAQAIVEALPDPAAPAPAKPLEPDPKAEKLPPERADARDRSKQALLNVLSPNGRCAACHEPGVVEVDHIDGRDWSPRTFSKTQRAAKYWDEYDAGAKLRALCRSCNGSDGAKNKQEHARADALDQIDETLDALESYLDAHAAD